jgi:TIR domain
VEQLGGKDSKKSGVVENKVSPDSLSDDFVEIVKNSPETGLISRDGFNLTGKALPASIGSKARPTDIFVCYRREDSQHITERICDRLYSAIGEDRVFKDIDSIPLGIRDFGEEITARLREIRFFLPVIGQDWLDVQNEEGQRRLDDDDDFVRMEIGLALASDAQIIPLLVDGAVMPSSANLPKNLQKLARRPTLEVRGGRDFKNDMQRLVNHINSAPWNDPD